MTTDQQIPAAKDFKDRTATPLPLTIAASGSISGIVDLQGCNMGALIMPAALTGTAVTFLASADGIYFYPMYNASNVQLSIPFTALAGGKWIQFNPGDFATPRFLQIVSNGTEASNRIFQIVPRNY